MSYIFWLPDKGYWVYPCDGHVICVGTSEVLRLSVGRPLEVDKYLARPGLSVVPLASALVVRRQGLSGGDGEIIDVVPRREVSAESAEYYDEEHLRQVINCVAVGDVLVTKKNGNWRGGTYCVFAPDDGMEHCAELPSSWFACQGESIFARQRRGREDWLVAYDHLFRLLWEVPLGKTAWLGYKAIRPQLLNELVIIDAGSERDRPGTGEVSAFDASTGARVWQQLFPLEPSNAVVIGERVYVACGASFYVLDGHTGARLVERHTELADNASTSLWTDGRHLYFLSQQSAVIQIYSLDGQELLQSIELPAPFTVPYSYTPVAHEGYLYVPLDPRDSSQAKAEHGLLRIPLGDPQSAAEIAFEPKPPMIIGRKETPESGASYAIDIMPESLDDLLRFAEIEIKKIAGTYGYHRNVAAARDQTFNGQIVLKIAPGRLDREAAEQKLIILQERIKRWASDMEVISGDRKSDLQVSWEWR